MSTFPKSHKGSEHHHDADVMGSGQKGSLKSNKLAKRARSFKEDLLEKIAQIRPANASTRSLSPSGIKGKHNKSIHQEELKPVHDLSYHVKQVMHALTHFKDVITKNKLEMLHGNGTIVLETVTNVLTALKSYKLNEHSSTLISATQQVNLSLGNLIKLCDDVLLSENEENCVSLNKENVKETIDLVEKAITNLVEIVQERMNHEDIVQLKCNSLQRASIDSISSQRTSLPDIPLTPKERTILEQSVTMKPVRTSLSTDSILRDSSPPPKPPLPNRSTDPPPLPPKKKNTHKVISLSNLPILLNNESMDTNSFSLCKVNSDRLSSRSRSPEDNSDLLSTCSTDSALNHTRDESINLSSENFDFKSNFPSDIVQSLKHLDISDNNRLSFESGKDSTCSYRSTLMQHQNHCQIISKSSSSNISQQTTQSETTSDILLSSSKSSHVASSVTEMNNQAIKMESFEKNENLSLFMKNEQRGASNSNSMLEDSFNMVDEMKPPLPVKTRNRSFRRSQYDNLDETDHHHDGLPELFSFPMERLGMKHKYQSCIETREQPPPLPVKKKHIMAYMEIFGNCSHNSHNTDLIRHSMHTFNTHSQSTECSSSSSSTLVHQQNITHSQTMSLSPISSMGTPPSSPKLMINDNLRVVPPALPPKRPRLNSKSSISTPPASPKLKSDKDTLPQIPIHRNIPDVSQKPAPEYNLTPPFSPRNHQKVVANNSQNTNEHIIKLENDNNNNNKNNVNVFKTIDQSFSPNNVSSNNKAVLEPAVLNTKPVNVTGNENSSRNSTEDVVVVLRDKQNSNSTEQNLMEEIDISKYLIFKKDNEDGPDVKGGLLDALIIHATKVQKSSEAFGEAFITTFRTFITPYDLIEKLTYRYTFFKCQINDKKQKAAKESFSLLVRVVNDLTAPDLTDTLLLKLMEFVYQLVCAGELLLAKLLRVKFIEKAKMYKHKGYISPGLTSRAIITNPPCLLDLKSMDIAEQMTLLDAELFHKIEIPEVLIWAQEQCEERSPNLTLFTEHFNKMSYWARTQILKQPDAKDRERHVLKFIKIMKHLRKMNNYNSYLALLSALDSAPVRRLEWQKQITEGLKEYCALIDSSSSFRAYRQALSETTPPCIPYIGLVLQDLTFVHIGNPDYLSDGSINFSKRWQQYNIVVNMKRFRKGSYGFKRHERIIDFFDNFENYFDEDAMWQISESIKPRGGRKNL